jgi:hypothetical protein
MTSGLEKITLNGVDFNDQVKLAMEALTFTPAQAKPKFVENPNADGALLVEEPQYTPAYFDMLVRVLPTKEIDTALAIVGEVLDALTACARTDGGSLADWTPSNSVQPYEAYALLGELLELPTTPNGDLAGWFIASPVLKIKLTCRPFLFQEERIVLSAVESSESLQVAYIKGIGGDVPAEARVVFKDKATQKRRYLELGQDLVGSEEGNPALQVKATSMTTTGYLGALVERSGSLSTKVVKATLVNKPQVICSSGKLANVGSYKLKLRAEASGAGARVRAVYRTGEGPRTPLPWIELPQPGNWCEINLREMLVEEAEHGEQITEVLLEGESAESNTIYVDTLDLIPTRRYGVARAYIPTNLEPSDVLVGLDSFEQSEIFTKLSELTATIGGKWTTAGSAKGDFLFDAKNNQVYRTAVSDTEGEGRVGILGTTEYSDIVISSYQYIPADSAGGFGQYGIVGRYKKVASVGGLYFYVTAYSTEADTWQVATGGAFGNIIASGHTPYQMYGRWVHLVAVIKSTGDWQFWIDGILVRRGYSSLLIAGGELEKGKIGLYDQHVQPPPAITRYYKEFSAWVPEVSPVCNSGKALEIGGDTAEKEDSTGKFWSPVPMYRGSDFFLDPAGPTGQVNRLVVKARRTDIEEEPDLALTDKQSIEVFARERFLAPR